MSSTAHDACSTERGTRAYLAAIAGVTPRPVRTLVDTHHHGDHTFGSYLFAGTTIVAHEGTRDGVKQWGMPFDAPVWTPVDWGDIELAPPFLTFKDEVTVWLHTFLNDGTGEIRVDVIDVPPPVIDGA